MVSATVVACAAPYDTGGLGQHLAEVVEEARAAGRLRAYYATALRPGDLAARAVRVSWLPWVMCYTPVRFSPTWKGYLGAASFDRAVAARLEPADTFVGFAGMALHSFRRARRLGYRQLRLESPTAHLLHVRRQYDRAYRLHPIEEDCIGRAFVRRALAEYELADVIVVNSEYARETFLAAGVPASRLCRRVLHVAPRFQPPVPRPPRTPFTVVYVGSLSVIKGVPVLLDAFARFEDREAELRLVGGSGTRGMRRYLERRLGSDPRVRVTCDDPLPHLREASVLIHPSYQDGFGYAPMEALACGVPVVVTDQTGMKEYVREGDNGFVVPTGDPEALLTRLRALARAAG